MPFWRSSLIVALVATFALRVVVDVLNVRALAPEAPADFRDLYDADAYRRMQAYTRARTRFAWIAAGVHLALLLAFWLSGGFGALDRWTRALGWSEVPTGLAFLTVLFLADVVTRLPFDWYSTFVIETDHGFNRTTPRTFWTDVATGLGLAVVVGGPLAAAVLWLFGSAGPRAWLWCWAVVTAWTIAVQYVAPTWIMPLFNRFTSLPDGPLRTALLELGARLGFPLAGVWVIDGSKRSTKANAFFTGFGSRKRIALFDTLLASLSQDEVVAVSAHEIGHYKRGHVQWGIAIAVLHTGVLLFLLSLVLRAPALFAVFGIDQPSAHAGLVVFAILMAPIELPLAIAGNALSRRHEYAADRFAADALGTGRDLARALRRLAADTLANLTPHPWYVALHHSHPPVVERVRALDDY
jgi:STE24 endopeptidase